MELRQIRYFVAVAERENFTLAALTMHIVQSELSTSIRQLEEKLGKALLIRFTRKVRLPLHGRPFLPLAQRFVDSVEQAVEEI